MWGIFSVATLPYLDAFQVSTSILMWAALAESELASIHPFTGPGLTNFQGSVLILEEAVVCSLPVPWLLHRTSRSVNTYTIWMYYSQRVTVQNVQYPRQALRGIFVCLSNENSFLMSSIRACSGISVSSLVLSAHIDTKRCKMVQMVKGLLLPTSRVKQCMVDPVVLVCLVSDFFLVHCIVVLTFDSEVKIRFVSYITITDFVSSETCT